MMIKRGTKKKNETKKQIRNELEAAGRQVSVSTVNCVLHRHGLTGCGTRKTRHLSLQITWTKRKPSGGKLHG